MTLRNMTKFLKRQGHLEFKIALTSRTGERKAVEKLAFARGNVQLNVHPAHLILYQYKVD